MGFDVVILVMLAGVATVCVLAFDVLLRRPDVGFGFLVAITVLDAALRGDTLAFRVLGPTIFLSDVVTVLLLAAALTRCLRLRRWTLMDRLVVAILVLVCLSLLLGIAENGLEPAAREARRPLQFFGAAFYLGTAYFSEVTWSRVARLWLWGAVGMAAVTVVRWVSLMTGVGIGVLATRYDAPIRVLSGYETFFLAAAFFVTIDVWRKDSAFASPLMRLSSAALFIMTLVLNRRTVWLTLLVGLALLVLRGKTFGRRGATLFIAGVALCGAVIMMLPGGDFDDEEVAQSATDTGTLEWRIEGWRQLIDTGPDSRTDWLFGLSYGNGWDRQLSEFRVQASSPHNFYLELMLRIGLVGAGLFMWLTARAMLDVQKAPARRDRLLSPEILFVLLAMQVVWFTTWQPGSEQGAIIGLAMVAGREAARSRDTGREPPANIVSGDSLV